MTPSPVTTYDPSKTYVGHVHPDGWLASREHSSGVPGRSYKQAKLAVYRIHEDEPNEWGGVGTVERHPEWNDLDFPDAASCCQFMLDHGLIAEWAG